MVLLYSSAVAVRGVPASRWFKPVLKRLLRANKGDLANFRGSFSIRTKSLIFSYKVLPETEKPRLAVSVAKKVAKRAVDRNRLKRQCREALLLALPLLRSPVIGVVRIMDKAVSFDDLEKQIKDIFENKLDSTGVLSEG